MNFSLYEYSTALKKPKLKVNSLLEDKDGNIFTEGSSFSGVKTPFKAVRNLPDTPEQFLRSGSLSNKSQASNRSYSRQPNMFESPNLSSFDRKLATDSDVQLKKLENLVKNKEKRLNEQEILIKNEKEELRREKCEFERKILRKKDKFKRIKLQVREKTEALDRKMEEIDLKFLEVKEMVLEFEAGKEKFRESVRNEVFKELSIENKSETVEFPGKTEENFKNSTKIFNKNPSFSVEHKDYYSLGTENKVKNDKNQEELQRKLENIKIIEANLQEKLNLLETQEKKFLYSQEESMKSSNLLKNLQTELEFYQSKCKTLEKKLITMESQPTKEVLTQIKQALLSKDAEVHAKLQLLASQQAQMTQQSLKISEELKSLQRKEAELEKLSADLRQKEAELVLKAQEMEKAAALVQTINEELANEKKKQAEAQEEIQITMKKLKKVADKQMERENLIKFHEEKLNISSF